MKSDSHILRKSSPGTEDKWVKVQAFVYSKIGIHKLELCRVVYITVSASSTDCVLHYASTRAFLFVSPLKCFVVFFRVGEHMVLADIQQ